MKTRNILFLVLLLLCQTGLGQLPRNEAFRQKYQLKEVVVLSRHNIRSPLSTDGSALSLMTPHKWHEWSALPGELTLRGGVLETMMGQYFRKWLEGEGLIKENHQPTDNEICFYANSMQRTIATAQYFSSGFLPVANVKVEHLYAPSRMDSIFWPKLTFIGTNYNKLVLKQIHEMEGGKGLEGICKKLLPAFNKLTEILDFDQSKSKKNGIIKGFYTNDTEMILSKDEEPNMIGSLKWANQAADALTLQYYEDPDSRKAAFGHNLSTADLKLISSIKDYYGDVLFTAPAVAINVAKPLLKRIQTELNNPQRTFCFLCGHDSNIASLLAALEVNPYNLPNTIEQKTPIGSKVVIEKWQDRKGIEFISINMAYQSIDQMKKLEIMDLKNPPMIYPLTFKDLTPNKDGLIGIDKLQKRIQKALDEYRQLKGLDN